MSRFPRFLRKVSAFFCRDRLDAEMSEEMRQHLELQTEENIADGMPAEAARYAALREFGHLEGIKEKCRDQRGFPWLHDLAQDLRYALRQLRKAPGFTTVAVLTFAIGIGATTTIFSVVNGVILRPLSFPSPDQLVYILETYPPDNRVSAVSWASYHRWAETAESFSSVSGYISLPGNLTGHGDPERINSLRVTPNFLSTLGVTPMLGRDFLPEESTPGKEAVMILTHRFWLKKFSGQADIIGQSIQLNDQLYSIIGVMPPNPQFEAGTFGADIFIPSSFTARHKELRTGGHTEVVARIKPGITLAETISEMAVIAAAMAEEHPATNRGRGTDLSPVLDRILSSNFYGMSGSRSLLYALLGAAGFLLLLACLNIANLLLARASSRRKEIAMRVALGASRGRIIRQMLCESLLLAVLGGAVGSVLGYWGLQMLEPLTKELPRAAEVTLDVRVLLVTGLTTLLAGIGFGLAPALHASRTSLQPAITKGGRLGEGRQGRRLRSSLVMAEIALALVLLTGAGLLGHSFIRLQQVPLGYRTDDIYGIRLELPRSKYGSAPQQAQFVQQLIEHLSPLPQVQSVAVTSGMPIFGSFGYGLTIAGRTNDPQKSIPTVRHAAITRTYFETLGIPLLRGRSFTDQDTGGAPRVAIISESVARVHFPDQDPIGQRISFAHDPATWREIIGIVGDVKQWGPAFNFAQEAGNAYEPFLQSPTSLNLLLAVRSASSASDLPVILRSTIRILDQDMPLTQVSRLTDGVAASIGKYRFSFLVFGIFSTLALLLAAIGIYGVIAYNTTQRTAEIGVRMALGAQRGDILRMIMKQTAKLVGLGVLIGLAGALAGSRLLQSLLFEVSPHDPVTLALVIVLLSAVALLACYLPARRATKVDPNVALRCE